MQLVLKSSEDCTLQFSTQVHLSIVISRCGISGGELTWWLTVHLCVCIVCTSLAKCLARSKRISQQQPPCRWPQLSPSKIIQICTNSRYQKLRFLSTNNFRCTIETCPALIGIPEFEICQGNKKENHTTGKDVLFRGVVYFIPMKCGVPPYNCFRRLGDARSMTMESSLRLVARDKNLYIGSKSWSRELTLTSTECTW